jgi:GR25 family glycosyltransferase involved in LPS biosynthesis
MNWQSFFDKIYVINLAKRKDRLLQVTEEMDKYGIEFDLVDAIEDTESGARGLRDTMIKIFTEALENNYERIFVFEDDAMWLEDPNPILNAAVEQLPDNWHLLYAGVQATKGFKYRHSANLLNLDGGFATHAVGYSKQCIKEIMSRDMQYPIDNWIVTDIQNMGHTYCTYPFLCTQRPSFSDIGKTDIDWRVFLETRYYQKLAEM